MTGKEIIAQVRKLNLPKGEFIVFGSGPLALVEIRESGDVDMLVTDKLLEELKHRGWKQIVKAEDDKPYVFENFEVHNTWNFSSYSPTLSQLLKTAIWVDDVPFASVSEVRKWKKASGRPKDITEIRLIDEYLANKNNL